MLRRVKLGINYWAPLKKFSTINKEIMKLESKIEHLLRNNYYIEGEMNETLKEYTTKLMSHNDSFINEKLIDEIKNFFKEKMNKLDRMTFLNFSNCISLINRGDRLFYLLMRENFKEKFKDFIKNTREFQCDDKLFLELKMYFKLNTQMKQIDQTQFSAFLNYFYRNYSYFNNEEAYSELIWNITMNLCIINRKYKKITKENTLLINELLSRSNQLIDNIFSHNTTAKSKFYRSIYYLNAEKFNNIYLSNFNLNFINSFKPFYQMNYERVTTDSLLQQNFESILKKMNVEYIKEFKTDYCVVDFLVNKNNIFEINGPQHYVGFSSEMRAQDVVRGRTLKIKGFNVKNISYKDIFVPEFVSKIILNTVKKEESNGSPDNIKFKV
jgi:hypothetical protein